ncbi:MAG: hypothetical protein KJ884_17425 [Gammaproteobacteria bacterium]|nr:hypothetical protein [Gammaproteobacteria bacterium]MBU1490791.1 hypothetical protein [Gammaproteobacteria bacterium]MBU2217313.1 hypothetical protein [Gammaproteobacteria bacterium]MBU2324732.1 hypothetical protein [Gammaproteobacteria bacterium]
MLPSASPYRPSQHAPVLPARGWPRDAQLRRRRSVLFAFTFSPPTRRA